MVTENTVFDVAQLKQIRGDLGFTQKRMAVFLGCGYELYRKVERGDRAIPPYFEEKVVKQLSRRTSTSLEGRIDWLRVRFRTMNYKQVICEVLKLPFEDFFAEAKGLYSYQYQLQYGSIRVLYSIREDKANQGVLIEFTGTGCREFELFLIEQERDWLGFFHDVFEFSEREKKHMSMEQFLAFPRFDIALDELYKPDGNIDLFDLKNRVYQGLMKFSRIESFDAKQSCRKRAGILINQGLTLNFGSRQSGLVFRFYQKDFEQAYQRGVSVDYIREVYGYKNRYELELHDNKAYNVIEEWYHNQSDLTVIGARIVNNYFEVYKEDGLLDDNWYDLLGTVAGFKFVTRPQSVDYSRTKRWVVEQVASALKLLKIVDSVFGTSELTDIISEAYLSDKHLKMAEEVCARNGVKLDHVLEKISDKRSEFTRFAS